MMFFNNKIQLRNHTFQSISNLFVLGFLMISLFPNLATANQLKAASNTQLEEQKNTNTTVQSEGAKPPDASQKPTQEEKASVQQPDGLVFQMRVNLGVAKNSASKTFKSDRLGAALFAGQVVPDIEIPIGFLEGVPIAVGASYQTFSGVDSEADSSWSLQALGPQARMVFDVGMPEDMDLAAHFGVAAQRLVSETHLTRRETVKWGGALTAGALVRWPMADFVHFIGGADLVLGSGTWFAFSGGVETNF